MWTVTEKCLGMIGGTGMSLVSGRNRSKRRVTEYQEEGSSRGWTQQPETPVSLQREVADPDMAETNHSFLETPKSTNDSIFAQPAAAYSSCQEHSSCVRRGWSDRLERTRQRSARSRSQHRQLRSPT